MQETVQALHKRRILMFVILFFIACAGLGVDYFFEIKAVSYFDDAKTNMYLVYFLIGYKLIELNLLYLFFYHRHMRKYYKNDHTDELLKKFDKNAKRYLMLIPHGSVIFGIISYKLTADIGFFLLFLSIAATALYLVKPKKALEYKKDYNS